MMLYADIYDNIRVFKCLDPRPAYYEGLVLIPFVNSYFFLNSTIALREPPKDVYSHLWLVFLHKQEPVRNKLPKLLTTYP